MRSRVRKLFPEAYRDLSRATRLVLAAALFTCLLLAVSGWSGFQTDAVLLIRSELTVTALLSLVAGILSIRVTSGRTREVRIWITAAIALWALRAILRDVEVALGFDGVPALSDLPIIGVAASAGAAYIAALRGHLRASDQIALYLDATILFAATAALMLTLFGQGVVTAGDAVQLTYAIFFLSTFGATLLLDLAIRAERRPQGAYVVLGGLLLFGTSFMWRLVSPASESLPEMGPAGHLAALAIFVIAAGTATWTDRVDEHPGYVRLAARLRSALPVAALALTPLLLLVLGGRGVSSVMALLSLGAIGLVLLTVGVRQSFLLRDREAAVRRAERLSSELATAELQYRALVERQPGIVYLAEPGIDGRWHYVSPQIESLLGFGVREWLDDPLLWARQLHPDDREWIEHDEAIPASERPPGSRTWEYRLRHRDGREVWVLDDELISETGAGDGRTLVQGVILDITDRKAAEQALQASEELTRTIIDTASYAFVGMDVDGTIIDWNQRAQETFGWSRAEALGRTVAELIVPPDHRDAHLQGLRRYVETGEGPLLSKRMEISARHRDGRVFPIEITIWPMGSGAKTRFNALVDDITVRKQLEDQLRHQALHDSLTGLANRTLFTDRVHHALERAERDADASLAVLFLDLDDFKTINDSLGHAAGDLLLCAVAERIREHLRSDDTAARLGGDEFAVLLEETRDADPQAIASRLLEQLARPFEVQGKPVSMQASIGVALNGVNATTPDELLRNADLAMYLAKARGKNRYELYEPGMHELALRRLDLKGALERAIAREELEVHYQPIVQLDDGSVDGVEALVRWRGPDGQFVPLHELIPLAEETGLIVSLGRLVLERACGDLAAWRRELDEPELRLAVNVSAVQLEHGTLLDDVERALRDSGLQAASLILEITESALLTESLASLRTVRQLRRRGIRLALDDFGTGYSSLARLGRLPVDMVKIDRSFIAALGHDREAALVQTILDLARTMHLEVVAEGIETEAQLTALRARGATVGQGYYFSRPVPGEAIAPILAAGRLPLRQRRRPKAMASGA